MAKRVTSGSSRRIYSDERGEIPPETIYRFTAENGNMYLDPPTPAPPLTVSLLIDTTRAKNYFEAGADLNDPRDLVQRIRGAIQRFCSHMDRGRSTVS